MQPITGTSNNPRPERSRHFARLVPALTLLTVVGVSGCTGIQHAKEKEVREDLLAAESRYRPEKSTPATTPSAGLARRARPDLPALTAGAGLPLLLEYALLNNPRAESSFYSWKAAVERITLARSLPDPMLTFGAEISRSVESLTTALMTDPAASWPGPGKLSLRADAAYHEAMQRRAAFENELLSTALAVKRSYYQLWVLDEQLRRIRGTLTVVEEMEKLARERLAVARVTQQDVLRAQMERDRVGTQLASVEDSRRPVQARLRTALGLRPEDALPALAPRIDRTPASVDEPFLLEAAFSRNPRLKQARSEVLRAMSLFHLARKSKVPDFAFGLGTDFRATPLPVMPSLGVTLPLWRDKIAAEIAAGAADLEEARARLSAEELDLVLRFAEVAFAWREADRNVRLFGDRLLPKAEAALDSARAGYKSGLSSFLDLLDAERTLLDSHVNHAAAIGEREILLAEVSLILLGRWPEGVTGVLSSSADLEITGED